MPLIYGRKSGQLCNGLWPFANLVSYCVSTGDPVLSPAFLDYKYDFEHFAKNAIPAYGTRRTIHPKSLAASSNLVWRLISKKPQILDFLPETQVKGDSYLNLGALNPKNPESVKTFPHQLISGTYLIHPKTTTENASEIRNLFKPHQKFYQEVDTCLSQVITQKGPIIGVHIRHGDYKDFLGGDFFYSLEDFISIMRTVKSFFTPTEPTFLICSNEHHDFSAYPDLKLIHGPGSRTGDLLALASADFLIGPLSTFSQWASFFGDTPFLQLPSRKSINNNVALWTKGLSESSFKKITWGYGLFTNWSSEFYIEKPFTQP